MRYWIIPLVLAGLRLGVQKYGWSQMLGFDQQLQLECDEETAVLDVTAEQMTFDPQTYSFLFEHEVHIRRCDMTILCDNLQVMNDAKGKQVERAIATGHVRMQQGTRRVVAERAEYVAAEERLVLTGNPRIWDARGQDEVTGEEIVILLSQQLMKVKRARALFHSRQTAAKGP